MKLREYAPPRGDRTTVYAGADLDAVAMTDAELDYYDRRTFGALPLAVAVELAGDYDVLNVSRDSIIPHNVTVYCDIPKFKGVEI